MKNGINFIDALNELGENLSGDLGQDNFGPGSLENIEVTYQDEENSPNYEAINYENELIDNYNETIETSTIPRICSPNEVIVNCIKVFYSENIEYINKIPKIFPSLSEKLSSKNFKNSDELLMSLQLYYSFIENVSEEGLENTFGACQKIVNMIAELYDYSFDEINEENISEILEFLSEYIAFHNRLIDFHDFLFSHTDKNNGKTIVPVEFSPEFSVENNWKIADNNFVRLQRLLQYEEKIAHRNKKIDRVNLINELNHQLTESLKLFSPLTISKFEEAENGRVEISNGLIRLFFPKGIDENKNIYDALSKEIHASFDRQFFSILSANLTEILEKNISYQIYDKNKIKDFKDYVKILHRSLFKAESDNEYKAAIIAFYFNVKSLIINGDASKEDGNEYYENNDRAQLNAWMSSPHPSGTKPFIPYSGKTVLSHDEIVWMFENMLYARRPIVQTFAGELIKTSQDFFKKENLRPLEIYKKFESTINKVNSIRAHRIAEQKYIEAIEEFYDELSEKLLREYEIKEKHIESISFPITFKKEWKEKIFLRETHEEISKNLEILLGNIPALNDMKQYQYSSEEKKQPKIFRLNNFCEQVTRYTTEFLVHPHMTSVWDSTLNFMIPNMPPDCNIESLEKNLKDLIEKLYGWGSKLSKKTKWEDRLQLITKIIDKLKIHVNPSSQIKKDQENTKEVSQTEKIQEDFEKNVILLLQALDQKVTLLNLLTYARFLTKLEQTNETHEFEWTSLYIDWIKNYIYLLELSPNEFWQSVFTPSGKFYPALQNYLPMLNLDGNPKSSRIQFFISVKILIETNDPKKIEKDLPAKELTTEKEKETNNELPKTRKEDKKDRLNGKLTPLEFFKQMEKNNQQEKNQSSKPIPVRKPIPVANLSPTISSNNKTFSKSIDFFNDGLTSQLNDSEKWIVERVKKLKQSANNKANISDLTRQFDILVKFTERTKQTDQEVKKFVLAFAKDLENKTTKNEEYINSFCDRALVYLRYEDNKPVENHQARQISPTQH